MVVGDFTARVLFSVVTDSEGKAQRTVSSKEVLNAGETIVTSTITHVGIAGSLAFPVDTGSNLMVARVVGQVVGGIEHLVLHTVVVGEELVTNTGERNEVARGFEVLVTAHNVYVRERVRVGTTLVIDVRIGENELVAHLG